MGHSWPGSYDAPDQVTNPGLLKRLVRLCGSFRVGSLGSCGDSGSNGDLDPEAEGEKVQLHKLSKNQASFVPEGEPSAVPSFASEGELSKDTRIYDLWIRGEDGPCFDPCFNLQDGCLWKCQPMVSEVGMCGNISWLVIANGRSHHKTAPKTELWLRPHQCGRQCLPATLRRCINFREGGDSSIRASHFLSDLSAIGFQFDREGVLSEVVEGGYHYMG